jgi:hypothetical protein
VKDAVFENYGVEQELQRLASTHRASDPGLQDKIRAYDLANHSEYADLKVVFLLPAVGEQDRLLDRVLKWARVDGCIQEYIDAGLDVDGIAAADTVTKKRSSVIVAAEGLWDGLQKRRGVQRKSEVKITGGSSLADMASATDLRVEMAELPPFVDQLPFNLVTSFVCFANMVIIGFEADYTCWGVTDCPPADRMPWYIVECILTVFFIAEVALRIAMTGGIMYFFGDPIANPYCFHFANCTDAIIVFLRAIDTFGLQQAGFDTRIKIISAFRVAQFARVAKLCRLVKTLRELWLIIAGIGDLFKTVLWVLILLAMILWVIAIIVTIVIGQSDDYFDYTSSHWSKNDYFATVPKSMYSMFQIMTLGKWSSGLIRPVTQQYPWIFLIIVPFLCIATVGLLNIIVGVVVENTLAAAGQNNEREGKETQKFHAHVMESLKAVFEEADTGGAEDGDEGGNGMLDKQELRKTLKNPRVRDRLKILDIPCKDLDMLFDTLDEMGCGEIEVDKFFRGCSRLRGPALAADMHRMSIDFNRYNEWTDKLLESTKSTNERLESLLSDMTSVDRDIIKGESDELDPVLTKRRERSLKHGSIKRRGSTLGQTGQTDQTEGERKPSKRKSLISVAMAGEVADMGLDEQRKGSKERHDRERAAAAAAGNQQHQQALPPPPPPPGAVKPALAGNARRPPQDRHVMIQDASD